MLIAVTFAKMLEPQGKLYGLAWRVVNGIVQVLAVTTLDKVPLQTEVELKVPLLCFITT